MARRGRAWREWGELRVERRRRGERQGGGIQAAVRVKAKRRVSHSLRKTNSQRVGHPPNRARALSVIHPLPAKSADTRTCALRVGRDKKGFRPFLRARTALVSNHASLVRNIKTPYQRRAETRDRKERLKGRAPEIGTKAHRIPITEVQHEQGNTAPYLKWPSAVHIQCAADRGRQQFREKQAPQ